jgi:5-methylcytosine-specific restriction endonuclease McrA
MPVATLSRPTLVLNRSWQPVHVATVARALVLLYTETARAVDPDTYRMYTWDDWAKLAPDRDEPFIRAVSMRIRVPEVVTLTQFDRVPGGSVTFSRRNLFKRDRYSCQYCGARPGPEELTIDHVTPRSQGGVTSWENCVLACVECNRRKADRKPRDVGLRLKKKPAQPRWNPIYAHSDVRIESWSKFISETYWNIALER